jgi:Protein of unknown function (DUF2608)
MNKQIILMICILLSTNISAEIYHGLHQTLNFDSARQSPFEALRAQRGSPSPCGKGDEEARLDEVVASQNSKFDAGHGIKEIDRVDQLETITGPLQCSDWLFFDIDYTLIEPSQPVLQMSVIKQNKKRFENELSKFPDDQKAFIPLVMVTQSPPHLIDISIPSFIQKLQDRNIPILGFTALNTSAISKIGSLPAWRAGELKKLGINFSHRSIFPEESIEFTEFPPFQGTFPLYDEGILYCNITASKGTVLIAFLKKISQKPSRIVLIDDTLENLQSVEDELKKEGIPFLGIHFIEQKDEMPEFTDDDWESVWNELRARTNELALP